MNQMVDTVDIVLKENKAIKQKLFQLEQENKKQKAENQALKIELNAKIETLEAEKSESPLKFFTAVKQVELWRNIQGGSYTQDVSDYIPENANGVILKVTVSKETDEAGSFYCGDENGNFSNLYHHQQIGVTSYTSWTGGLVFCPVKSNLIFNWKNGTNANGNGGDAMSEGTLLGYY